MYSIYGCVTLCLFLRRKEKKKKPYIQIIYIFSKCYTTEAKSIFSTQPIDENLGGLPRPDTALHGKNHAWAVDLVNGLC